jgi:hypothetical protein
MKTLHFASILAVSAATAFACNDDEDRYGLGNTAGTTTSDAGAANDAGAAGQNGAGGAGGAGGAAAGSGAAGERHEAGEAGAGGGADASGGAGGAAGAAGAGGAESEPLELIGEYDESFGDTLVITASAWGASAIAAYDNTRNLVYTQLPANDDYNPNKFTKIVYTEPAGGSFYYCTVEFSAETLAAAQASDATADDSDPDNTGCGGTFPWTKATEK